MLSYMVHACCQVSEISPTGDILHPVLVAMQDSPDSSPGKFVQPIQLVWLAMNVLMTLIKSDAMLGLLQHEWPGLVGILLQECDSAGQHVWMVMGCLRTLLQCLGLQVMSLYTWACTQPVKLPVELHIRRDNRRQPRF